MEWVPVAFIIFKAFVLFTGMFFAIKWHYDQDRKKKKETSRPEALTDMRLFATMIIALTLSLIGIVYAGCWGDAADGGYGGALGFAFTFFMLFMSRPKAETILADHPGQASEAPDEMASLKLQTERLQAAFMARLASVEREKIYLAVASILSTLAWKFGDIAAAALNGRH